MLPRGLRRSQHHSRPEYTSGPIVTFAPQHTLRALRVRTLCAERPPAGFRMISKRDRRRRTVKKAVAWAPAGIRSRRELLRLRRRPSGAMVHGIHRLAAALGVWPFAGVLRHTGISGTNGRGRRSYSDPIETASCRTKSSYRVGYSSGRGWPTAGQHRRRTPTAWLGI